MALHFIWLTVRALNADIRKAYRLVIKIHHHYAYLRLLKSYFSPRMLNWGS